MSGSIQKVTGPLSISRKAPGSSLSAFMNKTTDPVMEYSDRGYSVALSGHADFNGTLEYILATGTKYVVTDNTRGHGVELALAIKHRLGIDARPSSNLESHEWGIG